MTEPTHPDAPESNDAPSQTGIKISLGIAAAVLIGVVALIAVGGDGGSRTASDASGEPAPDVTLLYRDGTTAQLSDLTGTPVVLNFFADWCPACVAEMPDLEAIHSEFGSDVRFIGLDQSTSDAGLDALLASTGVTYDVALDRDGRLLSAFEGLGMPTTVFLYADGTVARIHTGAIFADDLRATLNELFFTS